VRGEDEREAPGEERGGEGTEKPRARRDKLID